MRKFSLLAMIEISLFAAMAFVFDLLPSIRLSPAISISFAMVPILLLAFRWGFRVSFIAGLLWGLLQVALGDAAGSFLTPVQGIIEYFVAFAFIGMAGLFYPVIQFNAKQKNRKLLLMWIVVATLVGTVGRYFWHFIAGFIFWGHYAPEGMNAVLYSFIANGTTALGAFIMCSVLLGILITAAPRLIQRDNNSINTEYKQAS